jgi:hypothetical protein
MLKQWIYTSQPSTQLLAQFVLLARIRARMRDGKRAY